MPLQISSLYTPRRGVPADEYATANLPEDPSYTNPRPFKFYEEGRTCQPTTKEVTDVLLLKSNVILCRDICPKGSQVALSYSFGWYSTRSGGSSARSISVTKYRRVRFCCCCKGQQNGVLATRKRFLSFIFRLLFFFVP